MYLKGFLRWTWNRPQGGSTSTVWTKEGPTAALNRSFVDASLQNGRSVGLDTELRVNTALTIVTEGNIDNRDDCEVFNVNDYASVYQETLPPQRPSIMTVEKPELVIHIQTIIDTHKPLIVLLMSVRKGKEDCFENIYHSLSRESLFFGKALFLNIENLSEVLYRYYLFY